MLCSPAPRLFWSKRGGSSLSSHGRYKLPANSYKSELELYNVQQGDEGDYVCRAVNSRGSRQTVIHLDVQGTPSATFRPLVVQTELSVWCACVSVSRQRLLNDATRY